MRDCLFPAGLRNCEALHGLLHQKFACNNFLIGGSWTTVTMVQVLNLIQCLLNIMNEFIDIESSYPDLAKFLLYTLGDFTFWLSLRVRPSLISGLNFGLSQEFGLSFG